MRKSVTKWDVGIACVVFVLSFGLYFWLTSMAGEAVYVELEVAGKPYARYDMRQCQPTKTIEIQTPQGSNTVMISDTDVRVLYADCPDQLDVKQGAIQKAGETIVCLPHQLVIKISGERDLDAISQ